MPWDVRGKTILVTGATSGIGLEASAELATRGARVVMVGRDAARTDAAVGQVASRSGSRDVSRLLCDFGSQASIRALAERVLADVPQLHVLVNNAGGVHASRTVTPDGIEATFAVNHLGYFLLTNLLLPRLRESAPARIVTVASMGHRRGTMDFDDLGYERGYSVMRAYCRSKLGNVLFASELARRLEGTGVTSNSLHPGGVATNIWSGAPLWAKPIIAIVVRPFLVSAAEGGKAIVDLAADAGLEGVTGRYFEKRRPVAPAPLARDESLARKLWDVSATMVGLPPG
jgi:NAD(P)-dependent dehydrogenase (short-subunit alcohol dehydrogenase family)